MYTNVSDGTHFYSVDKHFTEAQNEARLNRAKINGNIPHILTKDHFDNSKQLFGITKLALISYCLTNGYTHNPENLAIWVKYDATLEEEIVTQKEVLDEVSLSSPVTTTSYNKGYVVTCVTSNANIHWDAYKSLKTLANSLEYELVVMCCKWGTNEDYPDIDYTVSTATVIHDGIAIPIILNADLSINANAASPLSGLAGIAGNNHMVVPHPVRYMETTASPRSLDCRLLTTTGTISDLRSVATSTRVAAVTKFHACLGAVVIKPGDYPITPINFDRRDNSVDFEGKTYYSTGAVKDSAISPYIYLPDMHLAHPRRDYQLSLFDECALYGVHTAIGGDMFDGSSLLHHERDRLGYFANRMPIFKELDQLGVFARELSNYVKDVKLIIGNHETFADRFWNGSLKDTLDKFSKDEQVFLIKGIATIIEKSKHTEHGISYHGFMAYFLDNHWSSEYLTIAESTLTYKDIALGYHGNEYLINKAGARNSNYKICAGHTHAPLIWRNIYYAGYGGSLTPTYQSGMSKACAAHVIINAAGKRQMRMYVPSK
ncbi:MAG: hypothetical protein ACRDBG_13815 [Waterburya sp.]